MLPPSRSGNEAQEVNIACLGGLRCTRLPRVLPQGSRNCRQLLGKTALQDTRGVSHRETECARVALS